MDINKSWKNLAILPHSLTAQPLCLLISLLGALAVAGGCATITNGPVLLRAYQDRAAIMWETNTEGPTTLHYGKDQMLDKHVDSTPEEVRYGINIAGAQVIRKTAFIHKVWLEDLEPGQVYKYRADGPEAQSKTYIFHTTPAVTDEVTFIVYGDSRTRRKTHRKLVELMMNQEVDFVVHTGDLVTDGDNYEQWGPQFFNPLRGFADTVPFYIAKGNHEGNKGNYEKLLIPSGEDNSFSFDYGPVHYLCVDNVSKGLNSRKQLSLIAADAGSSRAQWKFVSYHVPSLNFGGHWSTWGYPDALPTLGKAGIDFVLTGHSHQYERFRPIAPPGDTAGSYVTYITCGGGGAPLYGVDRSVYHAGAKKVHHFCLFKIKGNKLTMDAIDIDGNILDHLEVTKTDDGQLNKEYLQTAVPMEEVQAYQDLQRKRPK